MATYVLIHGGGSGGWDWHLVAPELEALGHEVVAPDLPTEDEAAGLWDYADAVVEAVGDRRDLVVVGHSLGGFTAPLVCARRPVDLLVLVAPMIPSPGENGIEWWRNTGYEDSGEEDVFYHDVPPDLEEEARAPGARPDREGDDRAVAARGLARGSDEGPALPGRPHVHGRVPAPRRPRAPRHRTGRDGRRPLHQPEPPEELAERLEAYRAEL